MKKKYTSITMLLIASFSLYAQPVLNSTDFSTYYNSDSYYKNDVEGLSAGDAGANQIWDFSGITNLTSDGQLGSVPISSCPLASSFPASNIAFKSNSFGNPDYYSFCRLSPTTFETMGGYLVDTKTYFETDHQTIFTFPYTYNTVINDTYQNEGESIQAFTSVYDGYGTLKTPYGTYFNVLRQKIIYGITPNFTQTSYMYFVANPFTIILQLGFSDGYNYVSINTNFTNLSVIKNNKENFVTVYPNPTSSILNFQFPDSLIIDKVIVIDASGKTVLQQDQKITHLNTESLAKGVYIIKVFSGKESYETKFLKE